VSARNSDIIGAGAPTVVLHLSGPKLRAALERALGGAERIGGAERFVAALRLKHEVIAERLRQDRLATLSRADFVEMCSLMATVRRRIGRLVDAMTWPRLREAIEDLLTDAHLPGTADERLRRFEARLAAQVGASPAGDGRPGSWRFVRDLGAEMLHGALPEHYPLMTRWVWDAQANTGALREVWHDPAAGTDVDGLVIDIPDTHETFLALRQELSQFLSDNGVFRDMLWYVDLLLGQVYADYIDAQGAAWLKADFSAESDPIGQTRRILGVDARIARTSRGEDAERQPHMLPER
jgi:hypothetical protein